MEKIATLFILFAAIVALAYFAASIITLSLKVVVKPHASEIRDRVLSIGKIAVRTGASVLLLSVIMLGYVGYRVVG